MTIFNNNVYFYATSDTAGRELYMYGIVDYDSDGVLSSTDCNDNNPYIYPGATEIVNNGIDEAVLLIPVQTRPTAANLLLH